MGEDGWPEARRMRGVICLRLSSGAFPGGPGGTPGVSRGMHPPFSAPAWFPPAEISSAGAALKTCPRQVFFTLRQSKRKGALTKMRPVGAASSCNGGHANRCGGHRQPRRPCASPRQSKDPGAAQTVRRAAGVVVAFAPASLLLSRAAALPVFPSPVFHWFLLPRGTRCPGGR